MIEILEGAVTVSHDGSLLPELASQDLGKAGTTRLSTSSLA